MTAMTRTVLLRKSRHSENQHGCDCELHRFHEYPPSRTPSLIAAGFLS
jgi:hypothetical protein